MLKNPIDIRRVARNRRRALSSHEQRDHAVAAAAILRRSSLFLHCRRIALYLANDGELDPTPLARIARAAGKRLYLPVLRPLPRQALWFAEYPSSGKLRANRYGIMEPDIRHHPITPPWGLDLILLPLVAFDDQGTRLGMGGGFYDRTLAYRQHRRYWHKPRLIGLAHDCQRYHRLPSQPWDVPLDGILTETGLRPFRSG